MCVTLLMEPEEKKKIYPSATVQWGRAIVFQFFFSAYESLLFTIQLLVEEGREWSSASKEYRLKKRTDTGMEKFDCVTNYLERPYETTAGED